MLPAPSSLADARPLTRAGLARAAGRLAAADRDLARLLRRNGLPPLWLRPHGFDTLAHIILEQQVSLASARATLERLRGGVVPFTARRLARSAVPRLQALGVTRQKARYLVHLARRVATGDLDFDRLARLDDEDVVNRLTRLQGVGPWTASIYLIMALGRPDVWPPGDLALVRAVADLKRLGAPPSAERVGAIADRWRPFRSVAARILWHEYLAKRGRPLS